MDVEIARWRLRNQHLTAPHAGSAAEVVDHLLAVQAENPSQSAWAVAARTSSPDPAGLAGLIASGEVVRTHVLRPTWHYVARADIDWLLALTSPRIDPVIDSQLRAELTDREVEVLRLIARGRSNREVVERLVISPKTVGRHVENLYRKIGVSSRVAAAVFAMEHRLLD